MLNNVESWEKYMNTAPTSSSSPEEKVASNCVHYVCPSKPSNGAEVPHHVQLCFTEFGLPKPTSFQRPTAMRSSVPTVLYPEGEEAAVMSAPIEAQAARREHWNEHGRIPFPVDPEAIASKLGIQVYREPLPANTAGFIIRTRKDGPVRIVLNSNDGKHRQRFTLAHELGHYFQHRDDDKIGFVDKRDELAAAGTDPNEVWANGFAAELLMPAATIRTWWAEGWSPSQIREALGVSEQAFAVRMSSLGLLRG